MVKKQGTRVSLDPPWRAARRKITCSGEGNQRREGASSILDSKGPGWLENHPPENYLGGKNGEVSHRGEK